jgi:hypothetical protein
VVFSLIKQPYLYLPTAFISCMAREELIVIYVSWKLKVHHIFVLQLKSIAVYLLRIIAREDME